MGTTDLEYCVPFRRPHLKKDANKLEQVERRAARMIRGLEAKRHEERLKEPSMYSLEKRRLRGDEVTLFKYLKDSHIEEGQDLFLIIPECRTCNNRLKLQESKFRLNIRKNYLTVRAV